MLSRVETRLARLRRLLPSSSEELKLTLRYFYPEGNAGNMKFSRDLKLLGARVIRGKKCDPNAVYDVVTAPMQWNEIRTRTRGMKEKLWREGRETGGTAGI